jgi:phage protein U
MLLALGTFIFELKTAAFSTLKKSYEYRWEATEVVGNPPVLQALGKGVDKVDLEGTLYFDFAEPNVLDELRVLAEEQKPLLMVDGTGNIHGNWVIKQIDEQESYFDKFGRPRKTEFKVSLEKYSETGISNIFRGLLS